MWFKIKLSRNIVDEKGRDKKIQETYLTESDNFAEAGYKVGILIAPVILVENWKELYTNLIQRLNSELSEKVKKQAFFEIIFMTYSFVHTKINEEDQLVLSKLKFFSGSLAKGLTKGFLTVLLMNINIKQVLMIFD